MYDVHLACGDTIACNTLPALGAYRFCIHCDGKRRVTGIASWPAVTLAERDATSTHPDSYAHSPGS